VDLKAPFHALQVINEGQKPGLESGAMATKKFLRRANVVYKSHAEWAETARKRKRIAVRSMWQELWCDLGQTGGRNNGTGIYAKSRTARFVIPYISLVIPLQGNFQESGR
jgi:hypothetical protein